MAAAAAVQQPMMVSTAETPAPSLGLTARRPAANNLPSMELPALPFAGVPPHKPTPMGTVSTNVGNLLTPPSTIPGDSLSPLSSLINNATATSQGLPAYGLQQHWLPPPPTGTTPLPLGGTGTTPGSWTNNIRGMFSPSLLSSLSTNNAGSPLRGEGLPPPPFDIPSLPPFNVSNSMSAPASLPAISSQQPMSYMNQNPAPVQQQTPVSATSNASPVNAADQYMQRPQSTPTTYYQQTSQPQSAGQPSFPPFNPQASPVQQSPMSAPLVGSRQSPLTAHGATFSPNSSPYGYRAQFPTYSLPAMSAGPASAPLSGPIMTNLHNPSSGLVMAGMPSHGLPQGLMQGGYQVTSGQAAVMFGVNGQQMPMTDRPFKCDQCPQSFNRNHDLKRHKRIHLAVKPFPCGHCDKSFSRKDALKRHILVKGCGKPNHGSESRDRNDSPDPKDEDSSDDGDSASPEAKPSI